MKIVVYTCITNGKDVPKEFPKTEGVDYVLFTDNKDLKSSFWDVRIIDYFDEDPRRISRHYKTNPQKYFPEYDYWIWVDASISLTKNVNDIIKFMQEEIEEGKEFIIGAMGHPTRDCAYVEADVCRRMNLDDGFVIQAQMRKYWYEGYPARNGLAETGFLVRFNCKTIRDFNVLWWNEIDNYSKRDQLSFNYCLWKKDIMCRVLPRDFVNITAHAHYF